MRMKLLMLAAAVLPAAACLPVAAQQGAPQPAAAAAQNQPRPQDTEVWEPIPRMVASTATTTPPAPAEAARCAWEQLARTGILAQLGHRYATPGERRRARSPRQ